jgi:integrase/recombinase XerD
MTATMTAELVPAWADVQRLAVAGFLARYREPTLTTYRLDMRVFLAWCDEVGLEPLRAGRPHLELYLRHLEAQGYAVATIARRFGTVASFYRYAVIDGHLPANPADAVTRPKVAWEGQRRTVLHPLEFAAVLSASRSGSGRACSGRAARHARPTGVRSLRRRHFGHPL